jgi:hypothetical protein
VGQDRETIDPAEVCGPIAPVVAPFDSAKAMADAPPRMSPAPAAAPKN